MSRTIRDLVRTADLMSMFVESLKDDLPECHAVRVVLSIMHEYRTSAVLQIEGCKFLSVSVFNHDRNRIIVAAEGAVQVALGAMARYAAEIKLQEASCVLLTNLAHNCGESSLSLLPPRYKQLTVDGMQRQIGSEFSSAVASRPCSD